MKLVVRKNVFSLVLLGTSFTSTSILAAPDCVLPVNDISWAVAAMDNDGIIGNYHSIPWVFKQDGIEDGTVSTQGYWEGMWYRSACDKIQASTHSIDGSGSYNDNFEVVFVTSQRFVAIKNDMLYRFGKKKIDSDKDGVSDENDLCPETNEGQTVDVYGCSASQFSEIDCITATSLWLDHTDYMTYVSGYLVKLMKNGEISGQEHGQFTSKASQLQCW